MACMLLSKSWGCCTKPRMTSIKFWLLNGGPLLPETPYSNIPHWDDLCELGGRG